MLRPHLWNQVSAETEDVMSKGSKPDVSLTMRLTAKGSGFMPLGAFWRRDGELRGGWDANVVEVRVRYKDGSEVVVRKQADGRFMDHYLNLKDWSAGGGRSDRQAPLDDDDGEVF